MSITEVKHLKSNVQYWIDIAEYDIQTAAAMLETGRYLYVGFMCHQSIEKMLKAYYVYTKEQLAPRSHNLTLLCKETNLDTDLSGEQLDFLDILEPLNIEARYPTDKEGVMKSLNYERCKTILERTKEMMEWIRTRL